MSKVKDLPEITTLADDDLFYVVDDSVGTNGGRKIKKLNLTATAEPHATSHRPGGSDALSTDVPVTANADGNNDLGASTSFSKSDHKHNVSTGIPISQAPNQTNSAGVATTLAKSDHAHNIPTAAPTSTLTPSSTNADGAGTAFVKESHTHAFDVGADGDVSTIQPNDAVSAGAVNKFSKAGHKHAVATAAPVATGTANAAGTANFLAKSDHVHDTVISNSSVTSITNATTTSATDVLITSMTLTPAAGIYLALYEGIANDTTIAATTVFSLYIDNTQVTNSERALVATSSSQFLSVSTFAIITVNGTQAINARYRTTAGTLTAAGRSLTLVRMGA